MGSKRGLPAGKNALEIEQEILLKTTVFMRLKRVSLPTDATGDGWRWRAMDGLDPAAAEGKQPTERRRGTDGRGAI